MNVMLFLEQCNVVVVTCEMKETRLVSPASIRRLSHTGRLTLEDDDQN